VLVELALNLKALVSLISKKEKEGIYAGDANWRLGLKPFGSNPKWV
jgi:hypothetical protein